MSEVRVRFAPSPTGYFHIGSARTALYNWLWAKHTGGKFVLRIEDTDLARSTSASIRSIINGLRYLGINWDEGPAIIKNRHGEDEIVSKGGYGPYFQMKRKNFYRQTADRLLESDNAYLCFCTPEELERARQKALSEKRSNIGYHGTCRNLSRKQIDDYRAQGRTPVVRFRVPDEGSVVFHDLIRGDISVDTSDISDFVLLRSDGTATYNLACVTDDSMMRITDVIRGEDHISNTPKQILLYRALGLEAPNFAHLTMILDIDGSRLSKRKGARSLLEYEDDGFIREAMINYLSLLGWNTSASRNEFTVEELISEFTLSRCTTSSAVFDNDKLLWLNMKHIKELTPKEIFGRAFRIIKEAGLDVFPEDKIIKAIALEKEKIKKLTDIPGRIDFMLKDEIAFEDDVVSGAAASAETVGKLKSMLERLDDFGAEKIEKAVREFAKEGNIKTKEIFHPLRWAVSGRSRGPSLFEMCEFIGKERALARIDAFVEKFKQQGGHNG